MTSPLSRRVVGLNFIQGAKAKCETQGRETVAALWHSWVSSRRMNAENGHRTLAESVEGSSSEALRPRDWSQLVGASLIFGSAFMWMEIALRSFPPGFIAFGRVLLGAGALALIPSARCRIERRDWGRVVVAAVFGFAAPLYLILQAQTRIPSAVAGMAVSVLPVFAALVAAIETRRRPRPARIVGLVIGLFGAALLAYPNLIGTQAQLAGILLALGSMLATATGSTIVAPLQQTYGAVRVTMWLLAVASIVLLPLGMMNLDSVEFALPSVGALLFLGVVGTGFVWVLYVGLVGRIGAVRAGIAGYFIPMVALTLGLTVLGESVELIQVIGVVVALAGAVILSKAPPTDRPERLEVHCHGDAPVCVHR